jgi:hypothetical protein
MTSRAIRTQSSFNKYTWTKKIAVMRAVILTYRPFPLVDRSASTDRRRLELHVYRLRLRVSQNPIRVYRKCLVCDNILGAKVYCTLTSVSLQVFLVASIHSGKPPLLLYCSLNQTGK